MSLVVSGVFGCLIIGSAVAATFPIPVTALAVILAVTVGAAGTLLELASRKERAFEAQACRHFARWGSWPDE